MSLAAHAHLGHVVLFVCLLIVAAKANWAGPRAGDPKSMNRAMKLAAEAVLDNRSQSLGLLTEDGLTVHDAYSPWDSLRRIAGRAPARAFALTSDQKKWHTITVDFKGPTTSETANDPNPFLDYRLQVLFTSPGGTTYSVPGFYAGDGGGKGLGGIWRVRFSPDEAGRWSFRASFREGPRIAVSLDARQGKPTAFDGCRGSFSVQGRDESAPGFLKWGRLEYVGKHYLKFRDGPYWLKGGCDSPEDFLAYKGFNDTPRATHSYDAHIKHWNPQDPDWNQGAGRGIIGALNYLASEHVNSIYLMPMNIGGDGKNVWPYTGNIDEKGNRKNDNLHFSVRKLHQWQTVFDHAQRKGIFLHFVLNEAESANKRELDNGKLGVERKLFYRELVARFSHHLALQWNLCEEYNLQLDFGPENIRAFARYINELDPYDHPITVHHAKDPVTSWTPFLGDELFSITSLQIGNRDIEPVVQTFRKLSREAARPIPIAVDEFTVTTHGKPWLPEDDVEALRVEKLWPAHLSGGQVEFILGDLLKTEDFGKYENLWRYTWYARMFIEQNLPFWEMEPADHLLEGESVFKGKTSTHDGQVFAQAGRCYALYFPVAQETGTLDLRQCSGGFTARWYNPREGVFQGAALTLSGGRHVSLGPPPRDNSKDWAMLVRLNK